MWQLMTRESGHYLYTHSLVIRYAAMVLSAYSVTMFRVHVGRVIKVDTTVSPHGEED
jgi:hypothetical protein